MDILRKSWAFLLSSFISCASAEGFYVLIPISTSIKNFPEVDVLFRIVDISGNGHTTIPDPRPYFWCSHQPEGERRPGPDKCFDIDLLENGNEVKAQSQRVLKYDEVTPSAYFFITYISEAKTSLPQNLSIAIDTGTNYPGGNIYNAVDNQQAQQTISPSLTIDLRDDNTRENIILDDSDALLNLSYERLRSVIPSDIFHQLVKSQRAWILFRDQECIASQARKDGNFLGKFEPATRSKEECIYRLTIQRSFELDTIIGYYAEGNKRN